MTQLRRRLAAMTLVVLALSLATSANATYPGTSGEIAYVRYGGKSVPSTLRSVHPDGDPGRVLARPGVGLPDAEWSPEVQVSRWSSARSPIVS